MKSVPGTATYDNVLIAHPPLSPIPILFLYKFIFICRHVTYSSWLLIAKILCIWSQCTVYLGPNITHLILRIFQGLTQGLLLRKIHNILVCWNWIHRIWVTNYDLINILKCVYFAYIFLLWRYISNAINLNLHKTAQSPDYCYHNRERLRCNGILTLSIR